MKVSEVEKFYFIGNNLALDFINSVMFELTRENLLSWAIAADLLGKEKAETFLEVWSDDKIAEVSEARNSLREIVVNLANKEKIKQSEIDLVNNILRQTSGFSKLRQTADGFVKRFEFDISEPVKILVPVAESLVDLLCYGDLTYLRKCESPNCILYFYDTTKNHKRRWCSMAICGNRAKAAAFYQRKKLGD
mgnify:CR=1 FL=1